MLDHHPTVTFDFFYQLINSSKKIESQTQVGSIIAILLAGRQPVHKRIIYLRKGKGGEINYEQATGIAIRLGILDGLIEWYRLNKNWKDGGYVTDESQP